MIFHDEEIDDKEFSEAVAKLLDPKILEKMRHNYDAN